MTTQEQKYNDWMQLKSNNDRYNFIMQNEGQSRKDSKHNRPSFGGSFVWQQKLHNDYYTAMYEYENMLYRDAFNN